MDYLDKRFSIATSHGRYSGNLNTDRFVFLFTRITLFVVYCAF